MKQLLRLAFALLLVGAAGHAAAQAGAPIVTPATPPADEAAYVIVAVPDRPEPAARPGAVPRAGYRAGAAYAGSDRARALAAAVAREHALAEVQAWTIEPLSLRCMLYRVEGARPRSAVLARLAADPRVSLAQPLNSFETLAASPANALTYNDPYLALQQGFASIRAAAAQRASRGEHVRVAVIDTAIDAGHPDLAGRVAGERDFAPTEAITTEKHGTQVAGIIAAAANNALGIVGVAPQARLLGYRGCWAAGPGARCNSFTLAQSLAAAIAAGADVINLSLGGPRDPLLEKLTERALAAGSVVVAALPASGRREGFPSALPGVLVARSAGALLATTGAGALLATTGAGAPPATPGAGAVPVAPGAAAGPITLGADAPAVRRSADTPSPEAGVLAAPGRDILTLVPGGGFDFASGSSMAAAHLSGAVAVLRAIDGNLRAPALARLLGGTANDAIDLCAAVRRLRGDTACPADLP